MAGKEGTQRVVVAERCRDRMILQMATGAGSWKLYTTKLALSHSFFA